MPGTPEHVLSGGPEDIHYAEGATSIAEFYLNRLTKQRDFVTLVDGTTSAELTANDLLAAAFRVANGLRTLGVTDADKVAMCSENRLDIATAMFGTMLLGATLVPMNPSYTARELHHAVHLAKPTVVFVSAESFPAIIKVAERSAFIRTVITLDEVQHHTGTVAPTVLRFAEFNAQQQNAAPFRCKAQNMRDKVAFILYSSGTTGLPKGVEITEKNILISLSQYEKQIDEEVRSHITETILLSVGPWSHAFGCMAMLGTVACREKNIFLPKFIDTLYLESIQKYKVNTTHVVPPLMVFLAKSPLVDRYDLSSLKLIACGAAPLSKELEEAVRSRIGVPIVHQGYGMTEATLGVTKQTEMHKKMGSVGVLKPGITGRVVDVETGRVLPMNQRGELQFAGPTIMKGYIDDEAATRAAIDADGWLRTGDIGYYDEDGEWFIVDRLKELIKYNGFQVPPAEIEGILLQHPLISDAAVIGVPDERVGELPLAFVVRQDNGSALTERDVMDFVAERTSKAKRLHGGVRFVAAIPKNPSGKILRRVLRDLLSTVQSKL